MCLSPRTERHLPKFSANFLFFFAMFIDWDVFCHDIHARMALPAINSFSNNVNCRTRVTHVSRLTPGPNKYKTRTHCNNDPQYLIPTNTASQRNARVALWDDRQRLPSGTHNDNHQISAVDARKAAARSMNVVNKSAHTWEEGYQTLRAQLSFSAA
jgi:hypothetical protein